MKIKIYKGCAKASIIAPPSKSYAHRLLIGAFIASLNDTNSNTTNCISNVFLSQDIEATLTCLKELGASFTIKKGDIFFEKGTLDNTKQNIILDCNESGSTMRFLIPLSIMLYPDKTITVKGTERLLMRGIEVYEKIFKENDIDFQKSETTFSFSGHFKKNEFEIDANSSSQYATGLLFALSLKKSDSEIRLKKEIESISYIDITIYVLTLFGIRVNFLKEEKNIKIYGNQHYIAKKLTVEGDYSNAAFFEALNYIDDDNNVVIENLNPSSLQGDSVYKKLFPALKNNESPQINISNSIDLAPILFALAAVLNGAIFTGTKRLKIKESDRAEAMKEELSKFGANIEIEDDSVIIHKTKLHSPLSELYSHNDHRIAMALSVLLTKFTGIIERSEAVNKSFPDFYDKLKEVGIKIEHS